MSSVAPGKGSLSQQNPLGHRFICELGPSERVEGAFSISNAQIGRTRADKPYLRCLIGDKTGRAFRFGDPVTVTVDRVNVIKGRVDLDPVSDDQRKSG